MKLHTSDLLIICAYLIAMIVIGLILKKRAAQNMDSYFLGGKSLPFYMLGLSNASGMFDITGTMLMVYWAFAYGFKSLWIPWLWQGSDTLSYHRCRICVIKRTRISKLRIHRNRQVHGNLYSLGSHFTLHSFHCFTGVCSACIRYLLHSYRYLLRHVGRNAEHRMDGCRTVPYHDGGRHRYRSDRYADGGAGYDTLLCTCRMGFPFLRMDARY